MKKQILVSIFVLALVHSSFTTAMGSYSIEITQLATGLFSVELISSNSNYSNKKLSHTFHTKQAAYSAGSKALSGMPQAPHTDSDSNPCGFFQSDLM